MQLVLCMLYDVLHCCGAVLMAIPEVMVALVGMVLLCNSDVCVLHCVQGWGMSCVGKHMYSVQSQCIVVHHTAPGRSWQIWHKWDIWMGL